MSLKQNLLALIAALLFSIATASMGTSNIAALATDVSPPNNISLSASTAPSAKNISSSASDPISVNCEVNGFDRAFLSIYDEVASHIRKIPGNATLGNKPGGGWCFRYSCSYNLAIYGCNDNEADTQVPWSTMAEYADAIKDKCRTEKTVHGHRKYTILGQAFDAGGWNVILGHKSRTNC